MFGYFKKRREQRERSAQLKQLGEAMGEHLQAELDLFIELEVIPRRKSFLEVFRGELEKLDQRIVTYGAEGEVTRVEAAGIDYRIMFENWTKREADQLARAREYLREQFDIAEAAGVEKEYHASVEEALANQKLVLMSDGLEVLMELVPEARADHDSEPQR